MNGDFGMPPLEKRVSEAYMEELVDFNLSLNRISSEDR
jgi:hypothetical protein